MHELGIVFYIIRDVKQVANDNNVKKIKTINLDIGEVSGVVSSYLLDCWKWACEKEDLLKDCALQCNIIKAKTYCQDCKKIYSTIKYGKICPKCKSENTYLKTGNQVEIRNIEVE